jgi:hypothetical protein
MPVTDKEHVMSTETDRDQQQREAVDRDPYANAVIKVLAADFPDLRDPDVASIVRKHVYANARTQNLIEVIVDDPGRANWRLVQAPHDRRRVRLGCFRINAGQASQEREERLNAALDALDLEEK